MNKKNQTSRVIETKIIGKGKNLYMINWYYSSNHGVYLVYADSKTEARKAIFYGNHVTFIVTKLNKADMPVVFEGTSMLTEV